MTPALSSSRSGNLVLLIAATLGLATSAACGDSPPAGFDPPGTSPGQDAGRAEDSSTPRDGATRPPGDDGGPPGTVTTLLGVWDVRGSDATGAYTGKVELIANGSAMRFIRVVDYDKAVTVEGGRSLSWVWEGAATSSAPGTVAVDVSLQKADFIKSRGPLKRAAADMQPAAVAGRFAASGATLVGTFTGPGIATNETWSNVTPSGPKPIFAKNVQIVPMHDAASDAVKAGMFLQFQSFHALPEVAPYVNHPAFKKAVHELVIDTTDYEFYRANPGALRVVDKVLDPISQQETLARADAYKWSLAGKAEFFDKDVAKNFIDPKAGMLGEVRVAGNLVPSHDSALWTAAYMASQAYRYELTGAPDALASVAKSAASILTLTEITGNPKTFARTLRPAASDLSGGWHHGAGAFSALDWKEGGNNDMIKGVLYGNLVAHMVLCASPTGHDALCARLKAGVRHVADDLDITQESGFNKLIAQWVAAYVTGDSDYTLGTLGEWAQQAAIVGAGGVTIVFQQGIADWSGTHLSFAQFVMLSLLADKAPLPAVPTKPTITSGIDTIYNQFQRARMGAWSVLFAKLASAPQPKAAEDARWRLREIPAPKVQADMDHRVSADFVMSPYPSAPWKNDWTQTDRFQSIRGYPMFEADSFSVYAWKNNVLDFQQDTSLAGGIDFPGVDYLHAYWLGRRLGLFSATE